MDAVGMLLIPGSTDAQVEEAAKAAYAHDFMASSWGCLNKGRVMQVGTHDTLIKEDGFYKNLIAALFDETGVLKCVPSEKSKLSQEVNGCY